MEQETENANEKAKTGRECQVVGTQANTLGGGEPAGDSGNAGSGTGRSAAFGQLSNGW